MGLASLYTVDNVPWFLKIPYWIYGYGIGYVNRLYFLLIHWTSKIEYTGIENLDRPHILAFWHEYTPVHFSVFTNVARYRLVSINHPHWYMKPMHVAIMASGAERLIMGSSGNRGRAAADTVVEALKAGHSTVLTPDGPYGPKRALKKGILHISQQSGVPVVGVGYFPSRYVCMPTWDAKQLPLPFATIRVVISAPYQVTDENFETARMEVSARMTP